MNLPQALLVALLTAAATRMVSVEQRAAEQARTIDTLRAQLAQQQAERGREQQAGGKAP